MRLQLTQVQYALLIKLSQSFAKVLDVSSDLEDTDPAAAPTKQIESSPSGKVLEGTHLGPEIRGSDDSQHRPWNRLDVKVAVNAIKLHLYDDGATTQEDLKAHGIVRLALNQTTLRTKMLSDGAMESQIVLKSFTMGNTRAGNTKFREIVPAAQHNRDQVMILYTTSGGPDRSSLAVVTVDSFQMILAVEPVIALLGFFMSAFPASQTPPNAPEEPEDPTESANVAQSSSGVSFRVDLHEVSISVLENDTDPETQAIRLALHKVELSQQVCDRCMLLKSNRTLTSPKGILAASIDRLGMSLMKMGASSESVRFLDEVDLTCSLDSRASTSQQMTSIELSMRPIVFRASYRDINLITTIANKALDMYSKSVQSHTSETEARQAKNSSKTGTHTALARSANRVSMQPVGHAKVLTTKEQVS